MGTKTSTIETKARTSSEDRESIFSQLWNYIRRKIDRCLGETWQERDFNDCDLYRIVASSYNTGYNCDDLSKCEKVFRFVVYLDHDLRVRCARKGEIKEDSTMERRSAFTAIRLSETFPIDVLTKKEKINFKTKLANGFTSAIKGDFTNIQAIRENAVLYAACCNKERTKRITIVMATILASIAGFLLWFILCGSQNGCECACACEQLSKCTLYYCAILMGVLGAYASLWTRFNQLDILSYSNKWCVVLDTICRLAFGALGGFVALLAAMSGIFSANLDTTSIVVVLIIGLVGGFAERFIPSLVNKFAEVHYATEKDMVENYLKPIEKTALRKDPEEAGSETKSPK